LCPSEFQQETDNHPGFNVKENRHHSMNSYQQVFSDRHTILPVIHVDSLEQANRNVAIARESGANGVFLINHGMPVESLLEIHTSVSATHPDWWIGANCLGYRPEEVFGMVSNKVAGVWADNAGIEESSTSQVYADRVSAARHKVPSNCLYFGGVAFKGQRHVEDLEAACRVAALYMDVVTTSGRSTGCAADIDKIRRMKSALGTTPLAIASGITPDNVENYLPVADSFLVATGISCSFTELDVGRLRALVRKVRSFRD
jgi:predicted TIM-barrel enzyme